MGPRFKSYKRYGQAEGRRRGRHVRKKDQRPPTPLTGKKGILMHKGNKNRRHPPEKGGGGKFHGKNRESRYPENDLKIFAVGKKREIPGGDRGGQGNGTCQKEGRTSKKN